MDEQQNTVERPVSLDLRVAINQLAGLADAQLRKTSERLRLKALDLVDRLEDEYKHKETTDEKEIPRLDPHRRGTRR